MIKCSFKGHAPIIERFNDKVTQVTIIGTVVIPSALLDTITPEAIHKFTAQRPIKGVQLSWLDFDKLRISATGKALRNWNDPDDPILAERMAESRAKQKIYRVMSELLAYCVDRQARLLYGYTVTNKEGQEIKVPGLNNDVYKYRDIASRESLHLCKLVEYGTNK